MTDRYARTVWTADIQGGDYPMQGLKAEALTSPQTGPGFRVIAIPGTPSRDYMFRRVLERTPDDLELIMVTRAGYGGPLYGADAKEPVLDLDDQIKAIEPILSAPTERKTIVMGVSYGGALAFKCALDHPDLVDGVLSVAMLVHEPRDFVKNVVSLGGTPGINQALPQYLKNARREVIARRTQIGPLFDRFKTISQPVSVMHGTLDHLVPLKAAQDLLDLLGPNADTVFREIPNGTHFLELERPNLIHAELRGLMGRLGGAQEIA